MNKVFVFVAVVVLVLLGVLFFFDSQALDTTKVERDSSREKIGVILVGPGRDGGWSEAHYNGFEKAAQKMGLQVTYKENINDQNVEATEAAIEELVAAGNKEIFAISFDYGKAVLKAAEKYPDIKFFHATGIEQRDNVATYFGRIYQMRYLTGIVAGLQTETNHIGYVAAFPIDEVVRGINAFTLGVRSVNPNAIVHVSWTKTWNSPDIETSVTEKLFAAYPIDVMAQHQNTTNPVEVAAKLHKWAIGYNLDRSADYPDTFLTAPTWNWDIFYQARIKECLSGKFKGRHYWDGVDRATVDIAPLNTKIVKPGIAEAVEKAKKKMESGTWDVFYGPIREQNGKLKVDAGTTMSDEDILKRMDWFVEGVDGTI